MTGVGLRTGRRGAALATAAMGLALASAMACRSDQRVLEEAITGYILAAQQLDAESLAERSAIRIESEPVAPGAEGAGEPASGREQLLARRLQQRLDDYLRGRDEGRLEFQPDGLVLIRALNLGRGTYYETVAVQRPGPERAVLIQEVRLAYRAIDLSRLPRGTTIYLMGMPLGTVYRPVIGSRQQAVRELLDRLWLRWDLVRQEGTWKVAGVAPADRPPVTFTDTTRY